MTLIALTVNRGYPVMMADILISSPDGDGTMPIPTYINGTKEIFTDVNGSNPFGLNQKLYVINDRLCVALGGEVKQMEKFLKQLRVIYDTVDFDDEDLWKFTDNFAREDGDQMDAIILKSKKVKDDEYDYQVRCIGNLRFIENALYDKVIAGGSGSKQLIEFIQTNPKFVTDITDTDAFLAANQSLIAHFLGLEVSSGKTVSKLWGAGYEMIVFENGKFVKLQEYTVVLLYAPFGKSIEFEAVPFSTMMINYQDDMLLISTFTNNVERVFPVPSITDERKQFSVTDFQPSHSTLLMTYIFRDVDNGNAEYSRAAIFPRNKNEFDQTPIVFQRIDGKLRLYKDGRQDVAVLQTLINELN